MKIKDIEIIWLDVPFHEIPDRNMARQQYGWRICEICRVTLDNGVEGIGETLPNYTWGKVTDKAIERAKGRNPFDLLWDDSLGAGLQMALFDACGKAAGVPAYRLMGERVRDWCPISWWCIDMSPQDFAAQAKDAVAQGYTSFKQKARPWWDVFEQVRLTSKAVPRDFKLDLDFNDMLVNAGNAISVLRQLDENPNVAIYESPIHQSDVQGNKKIRDAVRGSIALHFGEPPIMTAIREQVCDGFVVSGGATRIMRDNHILEHANMPFWLQLVGTGLTTAMAMHLGAVCRQAQWPAITCMNMYVDQLVTEPLEVKGGYLKVPEAPGLGVTFNEEAIGKYRVDSPEKPNLDALYAVVRPGGHKTWYAGEYGLTGFWNDFRGGNQPVDEHGVTLETWENDGSAEWKDLKERATKAPVRE